MTDQAQGPCEAWPAIFCCDLTAANCPVSGSALMAATEILYKLSGQQFGLCEFTFRPCKQTCGLDGWGFLDSWWQWGGSYGLWPRPVFFDGAWFNLTCGSCGGSCSCQPLEEAWLPSPIYSVSEVKVDGVVLPTSAYRVDDFRKLVRVDGGTWPICQNLAAADTEADTWSVTLTIGQPVPTIGQMAVGELACEMMSPECRIPRNAASVTRQGVTIDFPTFSELLTNGLLGLRWTDIFISTYNPRRLQAPPQVYDVDRQPYRRTGT